MPEPCFEGDTFTMVAEFFYRTHDPTTVNRQGADTGTRELFFFVLNFFLPSFAPFLT